MKKNIAISLLLCFAIALSSVLLFGCEKKNDGSETYKLFDSTITAFKTDTDSPLKADTFEGISTNFYLKDMQTLDISYSYQNVYSYYIIILADGLNFIEKYYPTIQSAKIQMKYGDLNDAAKSLKKSYNKVKTEYLKVEEAKSHVTDENINYVIFNGFYSRYRRAVINFIDQTYSCANKLGNFVYNEVKLGKNVGKDSMKEEDLKFYLDFNILHIFEDYKRFLVDSCKGIERGDDFMLVHNNLSQFCSKVASKDLNADAATMGSVKTFFDALKVSRGDAKGALKNFSYYKFMTSYNGDLTAYQKSNDFAQVYYDCLSRYYFNDSYLSRVNDYLSNKLV